MTRITALTRPVPKVRGRAYSQHLVVIAGQGCWLSWQSFLLVLTLGVAAREKPHERWSHPRDWPFADCGEEQRQYRRIYRLKLELIANGLRFWPLCNQHEVEPIPRYDIGAYRWNTVPEIDPEVFEFDLPFGLKQWPNGGRIVSTKELAGFVNSMIPWKLTDGTEV